jgi:trk system potassium uptake protein TrkA
MRIVIVGAGTVGSYLAERLVSEGQDVVVIESDERRADELRDIVDCKVVNANGASTAVLEKAGIASADLLIAVTSSDAVNVLASQAAAHVPGLRRVARVADPSLRADLEAHGVDVIIDPIEALANELLLLVRQGGLSEVVEFADGMVSLFGGRVQPDAPLDGITLRALRQRVTGWDWIVAALVRDGETTIARGDSMVRAGDHVIVVASGRSSSEALKLMGLTEHEARKAFILGSTRLALSTATRLLEAGISTVLVDPDADRCEHLAERYDRLVVVKGDPTDPAVLEAEDVGNADVVLGLSGWDHVNILGCLVAKALGVPMAVSRFQRFEYVSLLSGHGIDAGVSTRLAAVNEILRLVRRGLIHSVSTFQDTAAEAIELQVPAGSAAVGKTLTEIGLPKSAIIGGIVRDHAGMIPHGDTTIAGDDVLIAITLPDGIPALEKLFG